MGLRREKRMKAVLPVRIWGTDAQGKQFVCVAHTLDVSHSGARVAGFASPPNVGETVGLQYRNQRVRCLVTWLARAKEPQVGLKLLQPEKELWGVKLPGTESDDFVAPAAPPSRKYEKRADERRKYPRFPVAGTAIISGLRGGEGHHAKLADISVDGCFIQAETPLEANTKLSLLLKVGAVEIEAFGVVRVSYARTGMGVQFTEVNGADADRLKELIARLERESGAQLGAAAAAASSQ